MCNACEWIRKNEVYFYFLLAVRNPTPSQVARQHTSLGLSWAGWAGPRLKVKGKKIVWQQSYCKKKGGREEGGGGCWVRGFNWRILQTSGGGGRVEGGGGGGGPEGGREDATPSPCLHYSYLPIWLSAQNV